MRSISSRMTMSCSSLGDRSIGDSRRNDRNASALARTGLTRSERRYARSVRRLRSRARVGTWFMSKAGVGGRLVSLEVDGRGEGAVGVDASDEPALRSTDRRSLAGGLGTASSMHSLRSCRGETESAHAVGRKARRKEERKRDAPFLRAGQSRRTASRRTRPTGPCASCGRGTPRAS